MTPTGSWNGPAPWTAIPALGEALDAGSVSGGHVDAVGRVLRQLEPCHRDALSRVGRVARQAGLDVDPR